MENNLEQESYNKLSKCVDWIKFFEQGKIKLKGHSVCSGMQKGGDVNEDNQNIKIHEKNTWKS